jgi:hypothetical protein
MQMSTSGGTHETEVKEFTVIPYGSPDLPVTVAIAMPVANLEHAFRNVSELTVAAGIGISLTTL